MRLYKPHPERSSLSNIKYPKVHTEKLVNCAEIVLVRSKCYNSLKEAVSSFPHPLRTVTKYDWNLHVHHHHHHEVKINGAQPS